MKRGHNPSGILIGWIDSRGKPHTKSIGFTSECKDLKYNFALIDAKVELYLIQLDLMQQEFETKKPLSSPIITQGLTRKQVRLELKATSRQNPLDIISTSVLQLCHKLTEGGRHENSGGGC